MTYNGFFFYFDHLDSYYGYFHTRPAFAIIYFNNCQ